MGKLQVIEVQPGEAGVLTAIAAVHALFESEQSIALIPANDLAARAAVADQQPLLTDEPVLILTTSGSAQRRAVELSVSAVAKAAEISAEYFHSQAVWLTCLPITGIGGLNTVIRSALAGTEPVIWPGVAGFAPFQADEFAPYISATITSARKQNLAAAAALVPTQLHRIAESEFALAALAKLDYVLVGGSQTPTKLQQQVIEAGVNLVRTYGSTETCGGVIYNGVALADVEVLIGEDGAISLNSPTLATGYRDGELIVAPWLTGDFGQWVNGKLEILGRSDDVVKVAGHKLNLAEVSALLRQTPGVTDLVLVSRADDEYGQLPIAAFVGTCSEQEVAHAFAQAVFELHLPIRVHKLDALPMLANGKIDRQAIAQL